MIQPIFSPWMLLWLPLLKLLAIKSSTAQDVNTFGGGGVQDTTAAGVSMRSYSHRGRQRHECWSAARVGWMCFVLTSTICSGANTIPLIWCSLRLPGVDKNNLLTSRSINWLTEYWIILLVSPPIMVAWLQGWQRHPVTQPACRSRLKYLHSY